MEFQSGKLLGPFYAFFVISLLTVGLPIYAQQTGMPPLESPRIDRVEKPYTAAEASILVPRAREEGVLGVWSTSANAPALCKARIEFTDYLIQETA